ncbi:hypothetical protein CAPTEDRAFT_210234 [Capitella teleta]|uniref:Uncharacterized protein n=1 Tax=Capitella teleta TaxID=283909 RepID=R7UGL1_CAPTE|nr:hypothetical protein CAPTEDRAFT_210234 [Capitella teleta]|eukprot:ELU05233.1 hypothetical protein CAPTEDRAFT_210234 [Capitella teleta]
MYSNVEKQQDFLYSLARKKKEPKARMKIPTRPTNGWGTFVSHKKKQEPDLESAVIFRRAGKEWRNFSNSEREHCRTAQESHPFVTPDFSDESIKKKAISHKLNAIRKLVQVPVRRSSMRQRQQVQAILNKLYASATGNAHVPYASITAGKMAVKLHGPLDLDVTKPPSKFSNDRKNSSPRGCTLLRQAEPGDAIMADKGFNVQDLFEASNVVINIPTFSKRKIGCPMQLS